MATATKNEVEKVVKSDAELLEEREAEIRKKYKRVLPGSIQREEDGAHVGKLTVEIKCGDCDNTRRVATSDLFQVKHCPDCTRTLRNKKRRKARAEATKDKPAKAVKTKAAKGEKKVRKARKPKVTVPDVGDQAEAPAEAGELAHA